jgi:uncharacterized membrane protein YvbJ
MDFDINQRRRLGKIVPKKIPLSRQIKKSISMLLFSLLFLVVLLSIVYLMNTTQSNQKGYVLTQEQLRKDDLMMERRHLINMVNEAKSLLIIENSPLLQQMVKPDKTNYISN